MSWIVPNIQIRNMESTEPKIGSKNELDNKTWGNENRLRFPNIAQIKMADMKRLKKKLEIYIQPEEYTEHMDRYTRYIMKWQIFIYKKWSPTRFTRSSYRPENLSFQNGAQKRARQKCQKYLATVPLISGHSAKILQNPLQFLRVRVSTLTELRGK